ncbi:hypothetical protein [Bradyrhizobium sp. dw_78]|uniref:hypothetical protein n=1 Tax=Bradyrhizobium sp. dw_78 TaxID=2719793 RepID=UPI00201BFF7B|nr:hypothetical protein [Bradyrhizobium sp. dw_78]
MSAPTAGDAARDSLIDRARQAGIDALRAGIRGQLDPQDAARFMPTAGPVR